MSKGAWSFKPADLTRAVKAVADAGYEVALVAIDIRNGKMYVLPGKPGEKPVDLAVNEWDSTA